jgi:hypothetical protein
MIVGEGGRALQRRRLARFAAADPERGCQEGVASG